MTALLTMSGVGKSVRDGRRELQILRDVDLEVRAGMLVVVEGPSGSGKSTLVHLADGWLRPDRGTVTWHEPIRDPRAWSEVGLLPQRLGLITELSVADNIRWPLRLARRRRGSAGYRRAERLEAYLGLEALRDRRCDEVSFGEQQRAALARALVMAPRVLLADEPTGHQDEESADLVVRLIRAHCDQGRGALVATHDPQVIAVADRRIRLRAGADLPVAG